MQEQFKHLRFVFKALFDLLFLSFRKVVSLGNSLHVLHEYFALMIALKFVLLTFVKI